MSGAFELQNFLPYLLNQAAEAASADFARIYKTRYGLLRTDWRVLFHLGLFGQMAAREIVARTKEDKTRVSRSVARLEDLGYLTRDRDPADRRSELLCLTAQGGAVYRDLAQSARAHDGDLTARLGPAEVAVLKGLLARIADQTIS